MLDVLPTQFNDATNRTIELIDVLWLESNTILAAFEIEATTSIYSGLLPTTEPRFSSIPGCAGRATCQSATGDQAANIRIPRKGAAEGFKETLDNVRPIQQQWRAMDDIFRTSRRDFLAGLAAAGSGVLIAGRPLAAQNARPRLINVHHHLTAPAYVKFLTDNKVREFPIKSAAEGIEDMDKAGVTIALCS